MVGVAASTDGDELSSANNPMIKYMLKARENHARNQKHDYSHVFRHKTRVEMFRLAIIAMAIELAYAAETSFVSPILLQIGIDHKLMTMAWGLSPLIGFFLSPLLGSVSDRCKLNWGRRRPIITVLSVGILLGLILVPYGRNLGVLLGDVGYNYTMLSNFTSGAPEALLADAGEKITGPSAANYKNAAILTILGMVLLDLGVETGQTPARTYMLDMCTPEDQPRGLTTFTLLASIGSMIGFAIGGIDWKTMQIGTVLGGNVPTVFGMVTIIFVVCYVITITTFREIPLKLIERDPMLKPLSAAAIKKELNKDKNPIFYIREISALEQQIATPSSVPPLDGYQHGYSSVQDDIKLESHNYKDPSRDVELDDDVDKPASLAMYLRSIVVMPSSMWILALTNLFCWMAHLIYSLYFTDFVGEAVFLGDPTAPPHSEAADLYETGVRFGCFGMSIYALSCSVYSMTVTRLMRWVGIKTVYITGILYYGLGMLILGIWPTKWGALFFSTSAGVIYGTVFTIPYILVANYHAKNCFRVHNCETVPLKQSRGLGTDVAIISNMIFVAQLIVSLFVGPLVSWLQTTCAILYASTFLAMIAAISAMFVLYV